MTRPPLPIHCEHPSAALRMRSDTFSFVIERCSRCEQDVGRTLMRDGDPRTPLVEALVSAIQWIESTTGCHCPECEDRLIGWKRALDPYLPTAADVFGILSKGS